MDIEILQARSRMVSILREFFLSRGYLETDTPALAPSLIPESCLEVFATEYVHPTEKSRPLYLIPSPEIWMKKVIAATGRSVFQLCKAWRNAESISRIHNPEFTMLEYYGVGLSSDDNIGLTEELFAALADEKTPARARPSFRVMSMREAWSEFARADLDALVGPEAMRAACRERGLLVPPDASWEDAFNILFLSLVEPALPRDRPLVLDRYPAGIECLAADIPGTMYKERWELYVDGIEIANCFTEMANPAAVRRYFSSQSAKKLDALVPHRIDDSYASIFEHFPPCSGVALGFERLMMVLLGEKSIGDVLLFPFEGFPADLQGCLRAGALRAGAECPSSFT
jgi:lysyl-tRNA synthetase class 2